MSRYRQYYLLEDMQGLNKKGYSLTKPFANKVEEQPEVRASK